MKENDLVLTRVHATRLSFNNTSFVNVPTGGFWMSDSSITASSFHGNPGSGLVVSLFSVNTLFGKTKNEDASSEKFNFLEDYGVFEIKATVFNGLDLHDSTNIFLLGAGSTAFKLLI